MVGSRLTVPIIRVKVINITANHFFDRFPEFYDSPAVGKSRNRLCSRYNAIIDPNRSILNGSRVLDVAAHDGRWSIAAIRAGAKYVHAVEGRQNMVDKGLGILQKYIVNPSKYDLIKLDIENEEIDGQFDVAMILGFLYHTRDQFKILKKVVDTGIRHIIIDTAIYQSESPTTLYRQEKTADVGSAIGNEEDTFVCIPSFELLKMFLNKLGFQYIVQYDWHSQDIYDWDCITDYENNNRITFVASNITGQ